MKWIKLVFVLFLIWSECKASKRKRPAEDGSPSPTKKPKPAPVFVPVFREHKGKIKPGDEVPFLGHGGPFESVQPVASKKDVIESDHAPHSAILEYIDADTINRLPESIKKVIKERKDLEKKINLADHEGNMEKIEAKMKELNEKLSEPFRKQNMKEPYKSQYYAKRDEIIDLQTKITEKNTLRKSKPKPPNDRQLQEEIAEHKKEISNLMNEQNELWEQEKAKAHTPLKTELEALEGEYETLKNDNELSTKLKKHNDNIRNAMGVLSIPYDKHRDFPTTSGNGYDGEIKALKTATSEEAEKMKNDYDTFWKEKIDDGISDGYLENVAEGKILTDKQAIWEHNFDKVMTAVEKKRKLGKQKWEKKKTEKEEYFVELHLKYCKKFMTTAIHFVKTPDAGYSQLMNLYINEYKMFMKGDFDRYKRGISQLLEANKHFGWIDDGHVEQLKKEHGLPDLSLSASDAELSAEWRLVDDQVKNSKTSNPVLLEAYSRSTSAAAMGPGTSCTSSTRTKRSLPSGATYKCIFYSKPKNKEDDLSHDSKKEPHSYFDDDGLSKPKISLPSDEDTVSIDSKRLTNYLDDLDSEDIDSIRTKQAVLEYASRNADKLTGTPEEVAEAKARLQQEDLDLQAEKTSLGTKLLRENLGDITVSPKAMTKYKQMKISSSRMATRLSKFTRATDKFSNPYGKIMLAKGIVTALRQHDYESLALMGGRIGLDFALHGVAKLGAKIAQKATTKFMTKFGTRFLGELAGPVGAVADIGISIYSITKSVKILNDPNASKFDRNDAIADIVADSIDIAVTATATVLSFVFPPLAPVFAAVAFVINLATTIVVAFYKAANNVDRINAQLPLLDYEKSTEYWRSLTGDNTTGYIQELIDTKRANNIVVNTTVEFLKNNTEYIGKVFPSRTLFQPETPCWLEKMDCWKILFVIPKCGDWARVSFCNGNGGYCSGAYRGWKCQSDSATRINALDNPLIALTVFPAIFAGSDTANYRCQCGSQPTPQWGYEIPNSDVDLRNKQSVHLQRAAPDQQVPPDFTYLCKPSTLTDEGERVSRPETELEYYCKAAIGIKRKNNTGKFMLYDLGNGTDYIQLNASEMVDNLIVVGDGHKEYDGNAGDDTFLIDGPCNFVNGRLDGKGFRDHGNSLVFGSNCTTPERVEVDLYSGTMHMQGYGMLLRSIQRVIGRQGKTDIIHADCDTKLVVAPGGESGSSPDEIFLPSWCDNSTEIIVSVKGSVSVHATSFSGGKGFVLLDEPGLSFKALVPSSVGSGSLLLFKFQDKVGKVTSAKINSIANGATIKLVFEGGGSASFETSNVGEHKETNKCEKGSDENPIQILLAENSKFSRHLGVSLTPPGRLQAIHGLTNDEETNSVRGYDFIDNVFYLISGHWDVLGGQGRMNQFILKSMNFSGSIDGSSSGQSTLVINSDLKVSPISIDFEAEEISAGDLNSGHGSISLKNIQRLVGRPDYIEEVQLLCTKQYLELGGSVRDTVRIVGSDCAPEVRISAKGKLTLEDRKSSGTTVIEAGYFDPCVGRSAESLDLHIRNYGEGNITLLLNYPISAVTAASPSLLKLGGVGGGQVILDVIDEALGFPNVYFEEDNNTRAAMFLDGGKLLAYHELNVTDSFQQIPKLRKGTKVVPNIFKLENGRNWRVEGGDDGDVFSFVDSQFSGSLFGMAGHNQLHIGNGILGDVKIRKSELLVRGQRALTFESIQEFYGRAGQSEVIEVGCDIVHVALNGSSDLHRPDQIIIPDSYSNCNSNLSLTIVAAGFSQLHNMAVSKGQIDTYIGMDAYNRLQFKADIQLSPDLIYNFPIQMESFNLTSYQLNIRRPSRSKTIESVVLKINLKDNGDFLDFTLKGDYDPENINWLFVDEHYNSNGNILINSESNEIFVLHILQGSENDHQNKAVRRGAVGAKNIFRLHSGTWEARGGKLDDSFILYESGFDGQIHGLQGVNSLVLNETMVASVIEVDLAEGTLMIDRKESLTVKSIQIVGGREGKKEIVTCGCDTKLIKLEGGGVDQGFADEVYIKDQPCAKEMAIGVVLTDFTLLENLARKGNFTYHVNASHSSTWDINYVATAQTNHVLILQIDLEKVEGIHINALQDDKDESQSLEINFKDGGSKQFPLNNQSFPTIQIGTGPELLAEIIFPDDNTTDLLLASSIIARSPFSGSIHGLIGVENGIHVKTNNSLRGVYGAEKDDSIFLSEVESILVINGGEGINLLQLSDELHRGLDMEVDLQHEKITFAETGSDFVSWVQRIDMIVGREHSFERVILGCDTRSVRWAEEVTVRNWNCGYNVKIEIGNFTRVKFQMIESDNDDVTVEEDGEAGTTEGTCSKDGESKESCEADMSSDEESYDDDDDDDSESITESYLEPSVFHYHFTSIRSFDIEVDSFESLWNTTHIFYLNFHLSNLTSIRFSLNDSRLIYSTSENPSIEYSHSVGKLEATAMFYSQPEFMTQDLFLLRITRYGEVKAVLGAWKSPFELDYIHQAIPVLSAQSERLGIGFMVETENQFIYAGSTKEEEVDILTNRVNITSHLIGWNGTTYEIIDMKNDTWIHPQQTDVKDAVHALDLSNIVSLIRNETGRKYIPDVKEYGAHLEIRMTNFSDKYPGRVIISNGTEHAKSMVILLNSIAMEIIPDILGEDEWTWKIKPRPISIPDGHTYVLAAEDLEEDLLIESACKDKQNHVLAFARDNSDLVIMSEHKGGDNSAGLGKYTSFVIFDFYVSGQQDIKDGNEILDDSPFERVGTIRNLRVRFKLYTVKIASNAPVLMEGTGNEVLVQEYKDVLEGMEEEILKDFPGMPRRFGKGSAGKMVSMAESDPREMGGALRDEL